MHVLSIITIIAKTAFAHLDVNSCSKICLILVPETRFFDGLTFQLHWYHSAQNWFIMHKRRYKLIFHLKLRSDLCWVNSELHTSILLLLFLLHLHIAEMIRDHAFVEGETNLFKTLNQFNQLFLKMIHMVIMSTGQNCVSATQMQATLIHTCQSSVMCVSCVPASCVHIWFVSCTH